MYEFSGYLEAKTLQEAIDALSSDNNSKIIAGGTDVLIKSRSRERGFIGINLVGITRIEELKTILLDKDENIIIGSACTFTEIEKNEIIKAHIPSLASAVGTVGGPQIRNTGTIGGNVANGATSADSASTLFAFNAILIIQGKNGRKEIPIQEFYLGPGKVLLSQDEVLVAIKITKENYKGYKGHYIKFAQRNAMDIATLGCSVLIKQSDNVIEDLRIAYGVAGPTPIRATLAEEYGKGKTVSDKLLEEIGETCLENTKARDSWRASKDFREQLIKELPIRAIRKSLKD